MVTKRYRDIFDCAILTLTDIKLSIFITLKNDPRRIKTKSTITSFLYFYKIIIKK